MGDEAVILALELCEVGRRHALKKYNCRYTPWTGLDLMDQDVHIEIARHILATFTRRTSE